ncbi:hypothetical protein V6Z11_D10G056800 [Gossypium hirsutum]
MVLLESTSENDSAADKQLKPPLARPILERVPSCGDPRSRWVNTMDKREL